MTEPIHIVCPQCDSVNRVGINKPAAEARCGRCHQPLFARHPVALDGARLAKHVERSDIPVLVDFWAAWCGPCKMMAPVFEQACSELEPQLRLAKVDTDANQQVAMQYGIRGIPTLILFHNGSELARTSGAADLSSLLGWVREHLR